MSNDLSVPSVIVPVAVAEPAAPAKGSASVGDQLPKATLPSLVEPNPSLQLEPALGLIVIQFRNDAGAVTDSIPSERQLQAYQRWATTQFGPAPPGMPLMGTSSGAPAQRQHVAAAKAVATREHAVSTSAQHSAVPAHVSNGQR